MSALAFAGVAAMGGCSQSARDEEVAEGVAKLSSNAYGVLGFESPSNWSLTAGPGVVLASSTTHSQGIASLAVNAKGTIVVRSAAVSVGSAITADIAVDVQIPSHPTLGWTGSAALYGECASTGLAKTSWGSRTLVGLPSGKFSTLGFKVPAASLAKLTSGCQDLRLSVALTVPSNSTGNYLLDNVQLGGPATQTGCLVDTTSSTGFYANYESAVTRPDLGTVKLDLTTFHGNPYYDDRIYAMNGIYVYESFYTELPDGTTKRVQTSYTPFEPHELITYSDGKTMSFSMDGKSTNTVPVGTDPRTLRFSDGTAIPAMPLSNYFIDAIVALEKDANLHAAACFSGTAADSGQLLAQSDPHYGNAGVSGSQCTGCELACDGGEVSCLAAAAGASVACGPFFAFCAGGFGAACITGFEWCQSKCHQSGTDCCPVACGGESSVLTPTGGCCYSGDSCARRESGDHAALCCGPGTTGCGGALCCETGEQCATPTSGPKMVGISRNAACCGPDNMNSRGECCTLGKCTTDADCGGPNACRNGCCIIG
jgi:hypothetical protein